MNNLTNKSFGEWSVMSFAGRNKYRQPMWKCRCSCGTVREIPESNLTGKASTNCGCLKGKNQRKRAYKHGKVNTPLYRSWANMLQRCNNPKNPRFKDYGGRGVAVCEEWSERFNISYGSLKKRLYQGGEDKVQEKLFNEYMTEYTKSYAGRR